MPIGQNRSSDPLLRAHDAPQAALPANGFFNPMCAAARCALAAACSNDSGRVRSQQTGGHQPHV
jgi:hypothetical protein